MVTVAEMNADNVAFARESRCLFRTIAAMRKPEVSWLTDPEVLAHNVEQGAKFAAAMVEIDQRYREAS